MIKFIGNLRMKNLLAISMIALLFAPISLGQRSYGSDLSATVAIPVGPNAEYFKLGFGAVGGFYYEMESNWRVGLTLGFIRTGINGDEVNKQFQSLGQEGSIALEGHVSIIPILLSLKYVMPGPSTRFYGIIEGGLYTYWTKANGTITYTGPSGGDVPVEQSDFSSEIGFNFGFGLLFPINEEISVDANARYHIVKNSGTIHVNYNTGEESVGSSNFLSIGVGANWNFDL
jgi:hypothetical protein